MPKPTLEELLAEKDEQKRAELLDQNYEDTLAEEDQAIDKTFAAQKGKLDKVYFAIHYAMRMDLRKENKLLTDQEKLKLGANSKGIISEEETEKQNEIAVKTVSDLVKEPTLEQFREFYYLMGMIKAKGIHELSKEQQEIKNSLPQEYDKETKEKLADVIALGGGGLGNHLDNYANNMIGDMTNLPLPGPDKNNQIDYGNKMNDLIRKDFISKLDPPNHPKMKIGEYMDLVGMSEADRNRFLKNTKCTVEDNFYDVTQKRVKTIGGKSTPESIHNTTIYQMSESCASYMTKKWMQEGMKQYESGLSKSELKEYQNGQRVFGRVGHGLLQIKAELEEKGIDYEKLCAERTHQNIVKNATFINEKLTCGKEYKMREEAGYSEAITGGVRDKITERAHMTNGVLQRLQSIPTKWKHHSSDSKTYTKALNTLKDYHEALARNDGGKVNELRSRLCKEAYDYVKNKRSLRRHPNGQARFNAFMTILHEELKPEEFKKIVDRVNGKRGEDEKISVEEFKTRKKGFLADSRQSEKAYQDSTQMDATKLKLRDAATILQMEDLYGPEKSNDPEHPAPVYEGIGLPIQPTYKGAPLSPKDFAAVSFANALSSKERENQLIENNILIQSDKAVEEGKKAADIAFKAYGEGDKMPLAKLLSLGIQKLNQESAGKTGTEKACMKEMSQRMFNMLQRDPELQKYAERQGLTKEAMKAAGKTREELNKELDADMNQPIKEENLIL